MVIKNTGEQVAYNTASLCLFGLLMMSSIILSSSKALADDSVVTTTTISVLESCSMSGTGMSSHVGTIINGTYSGADYSNGVGTTTLKAFCNDNAGFAIYAIGYTNDKYGNTKLHWSGAGSTSDVTNDISTGIYTSGSTTNSTWSMKLASVAGTYAPTITDGTNNTENFTTWHIVPSDYTKVAYRTTGTDMPVNNVGTGSSLTVTYDAYISATQPAGTYIGQVKYTLVHPSTHAKPVQPLKATDCPANSICYAPNANDIEGSMASLGAIAASSIAGRQTKDNVSNDGWRGGSTIGNNTTSVALIAPNFRRAGYGFAGWSTDFEATSRSIIYGPNETILIGSDDGKIDLSTHGLILYPVWVSSSGNLQNWTGCSSLEAATYNSTNGTMEASLTNVIGLTDTRDNNVYAVAKLADGNCWMIENLRLDAVNSRGATNISKAQGYAQSGTYGNFIGLADPENTKISANDAANSLYSQDGSTVVDIGTNDYPRARMPRYNNDKTNSALTPSYGNFTYNDYGDYQWYNYGNYYTWAAAMASTKYYYGYYNANNSEQDNSDAAGTSICPSGWKLPLGAASTGTLENGTNDAANRVGGFSYLDRMMGGSGGEQTSSTTPTGEAQSNKWRDFPNNFLLSGDVSFETDGLWFGSYYNGGTYWTSSAMPAQILFTGAKAYAFQLKLKMIYPGVEDESKTSGASVRCIKI